MDCSSHSDSKLNFKKGMTLSEYMQQFSSDDNDRTMEEEPNQTEDLYETCLRKPQKQASSKMIPFNIPEMDEDNYESSVDCYPETPLQTSNCEDLLRHRQTPKFGVQPMQKSQIQITTMYNPKKIQKTQELIDRDHIKGYRIKHKSTSPFKRQCQLTPTKGPISKTLYGNSFFGKNLSQMSTASSTLYQSKFGKLNESRKEKNILKGTIHSRESKNEKYFQNKNRHQLNTLIEYQNNIRNKYNARINILDIRVDGFKDKLYTRKNKLIQ